MFGLKENKKSSSSSSSSSMPSVPAFLDFHHHTLATVAVGATAVLIVLVLLLFKFGLSSSSSAAASKNPADAATVEELQLRSSVAVGYIKATINYLQALENASVSMLDLKSNQWRPDEREEMRMSHTLLAERCEGATSMFKKRK